jgi:short-subunit dehydrogenase
MAASTPTVLITGCSSGIGRALALAFHARSCRVYATARRPEQLADLAQRGVHTLALDVDDADSIDRLGEHLKASGDVPDVLINNAGYGLMGPLADTPISALRQQFETNVFGLMAVTRALLPAMVARGRGLIVNIGSVSGVLTTPFAGAYCASKAAVHALSDALRMELAPLGIGVMTVQPGAIRSQFGATAQRGVELAQDSWYAAVADGVAARAGASQQHATTAEDLAEQLCTAVLSPRPPALLRIGNGSRALPAIARWIPRRLRDRMLMRRFGLQRLARG